MTDIIKKKREKNQKKIHETSGTMGRKGGKVSIQPKDQKPLLPLSGTRNLQNDVAEKWRKDDTLRKKPRGHTGTFTEANRRSRHRSFRTVVRTEFINTTINNSHTVTDGPLQRLEPHRWD
jgi:hypothetical protein